MRRVYAITQSLARTPQCDLHRVNPLAGPGRGRVRRSCPRALVAQSNHWARPGQDPRMHMQLPAVWRSILPCRRRTGCRRRLRSQVLYFMEWGSAPGDSISAWIARCAGTRTGLEVGFAWNAGLHCRRHVRRAGRPLGRVIASAQSAGRPSAAVPRRRSRPPRGRSRRGRCPSPSGGW